jgi:hypothetical protein
LEEFGALGVWVPERRRHDEGGGWRSGAVVVVLASACHAVDNAAPTAGRTVTVVLVVVSCRRAERGAAVL